MKRDDIRMKNPNGYGSVYKLSGKRRKPWGVRITIGWDENGKQLYQNIGYYEKREIAMKALGEFNANPYSETAATLTFTQVFELWNESKFKKISDSNIKGYKLAFKLSQTLHDMRFVDIKTSHLQDVIDKSGKAYDTLRKIKVLFGQLYDYAMANDIVTKDYSDFVELGERQEESTKKPFTEKEIKILWKNVDRLDFIDTILIMIFTGLRPGELLKILNENIHLDEQYFIGGIKTTAGKNRLIPINHKIFSLIEKRYSKNNEFLIVNNKGNQVPYDTYLDNFDSVMEQLEMNHKPHECRHTFATLMDNAGANKLCIKRIMGHASKDITDKVYTHKDIDELKKAIALI